MLQENHQYPRIFIGMFASRDLPKTSLKCGLMRQTECSIRLQLSLEEITSSIITQLLTPAQQTYRAGFVPAALPVLIDARSFCSHPNAATLKQQPHTRNTAVYKDTLPPTSLHEDSLSKARGSPPCASAVAVFVARASAAGLIREPATAPRGVPAPKVSLRGSPAHPYSSTTHCPGRVGIHNRAGTFCFCVNCLLQGPRINVEPSCC